VLEGGEKVCAIQFITVETEAVTVQTVASRACPSEGWLTDSFVVCRSFICAGKVEPYVACVAGDSFTGPRNRLLADTTGINRILMGGSRVWLDISAEK